MQRFNDQPLSRNPHIAVLGANKIGNYVVCTPLLRGLKEKFPNSVIDYFGSESTRDFEERSERIDWRISWDAKENVLLSLADGVKERIQIHGEYDLAINCDGFNEVTQVLTAMLRPRYVAGGSFDERMRSLMPWGEEPNQRFMAENDWDSLAFIERHKNEFDSNYIGELMCRMAYVKTDYAALELFVGEPSFNVPDVLIHCTTTRLAKLWPMEQWQKVLKHLDANGHSVGLIGSPPAVQNALYHGDGSEDELLTKTNLIDLRGKTTLYELAGACTKAKAMITVDAGPLHIAAAVGCQVLGIFGNDQAGYGASPVRLWLPRLANAQRTESSTSCMACAENNFKNNACLKEQHECMLGVDHHQVLAWTDRVL